MLAVCTQTDLGRIYSFLPLLEELFGRVGKDERCGTCACVNSLAMDDFRVKLAVVVAEVMLLLLPDNEMSFFHLKSLEKLWPPYRERERSQNSYSWVC